MAYSVTHFSKQREERDEALRETSQGISRPGQFCLRFLMIDKDAMRFWISGPGKSIAKS